MRQIAHYIVVAALLSGIFQPLVSAFAGGWAEKTRESVSEFTPVSLDTYVSSVAGICRGGILGFHSFKAKSMKVKTADFDRSPLKVYVARQKHPAPLVVIIPFTGSFGNDALNKYLVRKLYALGNHVAVIPNPWTPVWIKAQSNSAPGDMKQEAQMALNVIKEIKRSLGDQVLRTDLLGMSFGAFVTAQAAAQDDEGVVDGSFTALSPPVAMRDAWEIFDQMLDDVVESKSNKTWLSLMIDMLEYCMESGPVPEKKAVLAPQILSRMIFAPVLKEVIPYWEKSMGIADQWPDGQYRAMEFFEKEEPAVFQELSGPDGQLLSVVSRAKAKGRTVRLILTEDDLANVPNSELLEQIGESSDLILLPHGGHMGYFSSDWFSSVLSDNWANN